MPLFGLFHLNMDFSAIPVSERMQVVERCYSPLLDLVEDLGTPFGVELTVHTLEILQGIAPSWIARLKRLLSNEQVSLIGSGYVQAIGPLLPAEVNRHNLRLARVGYGQILGHQPRLALVNEMALSKGLIKLYLEAGFDGLIMDGDNVSLACGGKRPARIHDDLGQQIPVLWSDSILFQKFQRFAHGDLSLKRYLGYVDTRGKDSPVPIYCNDAEVFDYRPGRFGTETKCHPEGEWVRIRRLIKALSQRGWTWAPPEACLPSSKGSSAPPASASVPVPVKKQQKYNLSRWAVTGRNDLMINSLCHKLHQSGLQTDTDRKQLLRLWASDLRTHITESRWENAMAEFDSFLARKGLEEVPVERTWPESRLDLPPQHEDNIFVTMTTKGVSANVNLRRGLTLDRLSFTSHGRPLAGTLEHGYFDRIFLGADFFSAGMVLELPLRRERITDLSYVDPVLLDDGCSQILQATFETSLGQIRKSLRFPVAGEWVEITYEFLRWTRPVGSLRFNALTLFPKAFTSSLQIHCHNGGDHREVFHIQEAINHDRPANTLVSCQGGFGATTGCIDIGDTAHGLRVTWDPAQCAFFPMASHHELGLTRLILSGLETDGSARPGYSLPMMTYRISPRPEEP